MRMCGAGGLAALWWVFVVVLQLLVMVDPTRAEYCEDDIFLCAAP